MRTLSDASTAVYNANSTQNANEIIADILIIAMSGLKNCRDDGSQRGGGVFSTKKKMRIIHGKGKSRSRKACGREEKKEEREG